MNKWADKSIGTEKKCMNGIICVQIGGGDGMGNC